MRLDATYTFCVFSSYLDIWSWRFNLGLPFGAVEMATFSRDASLRVAGYTIQKPSTSGTSLPSVNRRERERVHADAHKSYFLCLELPPPHARHASTASPVVAPAAGSVTRILAGLSDIGRQLSGELSSAHHEEVEALSEAEGGGKSRGRTKLSRLWRRRRSRRPSTSLETPSVTIDMSADGTAANDQPSPNGSGAPVSEATPTARSMEDEEEEERDLVEAAQQRLLNWMWGKAPPHVPKNQMPVAVVEESTGSADPVALFAGPGGSGSRAAGVISSFQYSAPVVEVIVQIACHVRVQNRPRANSVPCRWGILAPSYFDKRLDERPKLAIFSKV